MNTFWTIFFIALSSQGFFLAFIIITRKKTYFLSKLFLSTFIFLFSLMLLFWVGLWNNFPDKYPHFNYVYDIPPLLLGPLLLFYIKSCFRKLTRYDVIHCIPFILIFACYLPFYLFNEEQKLFFIKTLADNIQILSLQNLIDKMYLIHSASFIFYALYIYIFVKNQLKKPTLRLDPQARKFIRLISLLFIVFSAFYYLNYFMCQTQEIQSIVEYLNGVLISFFFYTIGYLGLTHSQAINKVVEKKGAVKYARSSINTNEASGLIQNIIYHIEEDKSFLRENYKLNDLSLAVDISPYHISEILNKYHGKNFSELINTYRVEEAKKLLVSKAYDNKTVSAVGYDVGFNSRTTFHQWFKKITGLSPAAYQQKHKHVVE